MELRLYDTLTRETRAFVPLDPTRVRMYVCGPTVYDFAHIGNARPVIVFDVLFRLLRHLYGAENVIYVRNITDVDDKINARAAERGVSIQTVTEETYNKFKADVDALGCLPPTVEPRATEHIGAMKELIERLVQAGCAYIAEDHVLFNVSAMPDYGRLSKRSLDEMIAGARVEVAPYKRAPTDFVLWKPSKPGEPAWPSPCGITAPGRPGWHIECSAMAWKHLGVTFDIHGGGIDLAFPHHENEIAQSRCAFHTSVMANYWMHNGFLQVEGEKMSKSLGNFFTIRELLTSKKFGGRSWDGGALRLAMLTAHYTQPIDWTVNLLRDAQLTWDHWKRLVAQVDAVKPSIEPDSELLEAISDDLNTPIMLRRLHQLAQDANRSELSRERLYDSLVFLGLVPDTFALANSVAEKLLDNLHVDVSTLNANLKAYVPRIEIELRHFFKTLPPSANVTATIAAATLVLTGCAATFDFVDEWQKYNPYYVSASDWVHIDSTIGITKLNALIERRLSARRRKDFKESDGIREALAAIGIGLKDSKHGTAWEIVR